MPQSSKLCFTLTLAPSLYYLNADSQYIFMLPNFHNFINAISVKTTAVAELTEMGNIHIHAQIIMDYKEGQTLIHLKRKFQKELLKYTATFGLIFHFDQVINSDAWEDYMFKHVCEDDPNLRINCPRVLIDQFQTGPDVRAREACQINNNIYMF